MSEKCFCHFNGYQVKDATARAEIEKLKGLNVTPEMFGAVGDGVTDDLAAIHAAFAAYNVVMLQPGKTYAIDGTTGLCIPENGHLIGNGATIKVIPNALQIYTGIYMGGSNSRLENVNLVGERNEHTGTGGEWGHGLSIGGAANGVVVRDCRIKDFWGDGIYVSNCENVLIDNVIVDNSRRNGISVIAAKNFKCVDSLFSNTNGTAPQSGIAIEANNNTETVENVEFVRCRSVNSASGTGIYSTVRKDGSSATYRGCETDGAFAFTAWEGGNSVFTAENCKFGGTVYLHSKTAGNYFNFKNCVITGSQTQPFIVTKFEAQTDRTLFDGCLFDGSKGASMFVRQEVGSLRNFRVKNGIIRGANIGRFIIHSGDYNGEANNHFDLELDDTILRGLEHPALYGDTVSCSLIVKAPPQTVSGTTCAILRDMNVTELISGNIVTFNGVYPGDVHSITNDTGASGVWIAFNIGKDIYVNGENLGRAVSLVAGETLFFRMMDTGKLIGWKA